jgi:hypothetical protein
VRSRSTLTVHESRWGSFTLPASDEVVSVDGIDHGPLTRPDSDAVLAALGGVGGADAVGTGRTAIAAGMSPRSKEPTHDIGSDYSTALFPRDLFISLRSLESRYPIARYPNLLLAVDEVFRHQGREQDRAIDPSGYERRHEALGKLFHEHRDPREPLAQEIARITGCAWPWFAADDVTGDGVNYVMERALVSPQLLQRKVGQPDGHVITYADAVVEGIRWQLRMLDAGRHGLILSQRLPRPPASTWLGPLGSVWKDSPDGFLRADGTQPTRPVALVEVQCILYRSLRLAAELSRKNAEFADRLGVRHLDDLAASTQKKFFETFWVDSPSGGHPGYFAEVDQHGRDLLVTPFLASSAIDTLLSGLCDGDAMREQRDALVRAIYDPSVGLRGTLGPRSLAVDAPHYYPSGGDKGAIWPYLNDRAAVAASRYGFHRCARHDWALVGRICEATQAYPEFVPDAAEPGFDRVRVKVWRRRPDPYLTTAIEPAKPWQLWTVGAAANAARLAEDRPSSRDVAALDAKLARGLAGSVRTSVRDGVRRRPRP